MDDRAPQERSAPPGVAHRPISFEGALTFAQYYAGLRMHYGSRLLNWIGIGVFAALAVIAGIAAIRDPGATLEFAIYLVVAAFLSMFLVVQEWSIRRNWRTNKLIQDRLEGVLDDQGLAVETERGSVRLPWDQLHQWQASPSHLLIYQSTDSFHILPRDFFSSEEDWNAARELAASKLSSRRRWKRRLHLWTVLVWIVVLVVLVVLVSAL